MTLLLGDLCIFVFSLLVTLLIRYGVSGLETAWSVHTIPFGILAGCWLVVFYIVGLYDLAIARDSFRFLRTFLEAMVANLLIALAFFYVLPLFGITPRTNLLVDTALIFVFGYAWRLLFHRIIAPFALRTRVLYIGFQTDVPKLTELFKSSGLGFELIDVIEPVTNGQSQMTRQWFVSGDHILSSVESNAIDTIVLAVKPEHVDGLADALYRTISHSIALMERSDIDEIATGCVPIEQISQTWFLEHLREREKRFYEASKRVFDLLLSIPFGILTMAIFPFVALLIKLTSRGTVLYSQTRTGKLGKTFRIWKFRTMRTDAEKDGQAEFAKKNDLRITPIGSLLRKMRIDELPQIWNVLHGDMSFIGPRPERPQFVEELEKQMPFYALRHLTKPGLTGWAQVRFPYAGSIEDNLKKVQYDLYYIKHRSFLLDVAILLRTIGIVLKQQGT